MHVLVPTAILDSSELTIPTELNHNSNGLDYIKSEIQQAHVTGSIPFNSLVVIKALQWISQL
jgi:hypothetical protein